jgi:hypothetical protein
LNINLKYKWRPKCKALKNRKIYLSFWARTANVNTNQKHYVEKKQQINPGRRLRNPYTLVTDRTRSVSLGIRPYFVVLHDPVLRSYISVPVYGAIRSYTEQNGDRIWSPCTETVNDRFFLRISPYFSVYDRLRPCLFDLRKQECRKTFNKKRKSTCSKKK